MSQTVLVFAEQRSGVFRAAAYEAVTVARGVAGDLGVPLVAVVIGSGVAGLAGELGAYGADRVIVYDSVDLALFAPAAYARCLADAAKDTGASVILGSSTAMGKDVLPRVAVLLDAACVSDATAVKIDGGRVLFTRPVFAGKALATQAATTPVVVGGLRPKVFGAKKLGTPTTAVVDTKTPALVAGDLRMKTTSVAKASHDLLDVAEADIIVSGGRSLKSAEAFGVLEETAKILGAAVGASRAAVDAGYRPHRDQVGLTGKLVSPTLYIAVGISGAIQHLAGMSGSKVIVAINKDAECPMVKKATYAVLGDLFEIMPALNAELAKVVGH